jgi:hypothetical protein
MVGTRQRWPSSWPSTAKRTALQTWNLGCHGCRHLWLSLICWRSRCVILSLNVHWIPLHVHRLFTRYSLNVHWMFTECLLNVHKLFAECLLNVPSAQHSLPTWSLGSHGCCHLLLSLIWWTSRCVTLTLRLRCFFNRVRLNYTLWATLQTTTSFSSGDHDLVNWIFVTAWPLPSRAIVIAWDDSQFTNWVILVLVRISQ